MRHRPRTWLVRGVVLVLAVTAALVPVDPALARAACGAKEPDAGKLTEEPWPLRRLRPDRVWPVTRGRDVVVAVVDSGVSEAHPALAGRVLEGFDYLVPGGVGKCDEFGHGTLIAGIIAGNVVERSTFHGIAPDAKILPVRVIRDDQKVEGDQYSDHIANGIRWAVDHDADVINLSVTTKPTAKLSNAIKYAFDHDVVIVAAAGNKQDLEEGRPPELPKLDGYPAAYEGVIGVAAVDHWGQYYELVSVKRRYIDLAAPGESIAGPATRSDLFVAKHGTSFATAYVSGVAALVRAARPDMPAAKVRERIIGTADPNPGGWNDELGHGVVNPYWAVFALGAEDEEPAPKVQVGISAPAPDPMRGMRILAVWAAVISAAVSLLLVTSVSVWRRGQRRRWRPGRPVNE
jgi:membrane-anchored mycosin MYCP